MFESLVKQNYRHVELPIDPPLILTKNFPRLPLPLMPPAQLYILLKFLAVYQNKPILCVCVLCILHHNYFDDDGSPFFSRLKAKQKLLFVPRQ